MNREQWLKERKHHIGASEVAAVLCVDPYRTPLDVYASKTLGKSTEDNVYMAWGRDVEGAIAKRYEYETRRAVWDLGAHEFQYHKDIPYLAATLDRVTWGNGENPSPVADDEKGPLELKAVGWRRAADWGDGAPLYYQIQLQTQIACFDSQWGAIAGLLGGTDFVHHDYLRHENFLEAAYPILDEFWQRVQRRDPPPPQNYRALEVVKRLYPVDAGTEVELDDDVARTVYLWRTARADSIRAEKEAKEYEATLRAVMADAAIGKLPDGNLLTLKTTKRRGYTKVVEPGEYRTLRFKEVK